VQASLARHPTVSVDSHPRRRHKQLGFVATAQQAAAASSRVPVAGAASLYADATGAAYSLSSSLGPWSWQSNIVKQMLGTEKAASRKSRRHRDLSSSLRMMWHLAFTYYATLADPATLLPLDPRCVRLSQQ
jgi:hypothetical protein